MPIDPSDEAIQDGKAWAAQFDIPPGTVDPDSLRAILESAYAAGWIHGWAVALEAAKARLEGRQT